MAMLWSHIPNTATIPYTSSIPWNDIEGYVGLSFNLPFSLFLSLYLIYLLICLSICLRICLPVCLSTYVCVCLSIYLYIYLYIASVYLPAYLSLYLSVHIGSIALNFSASVLLKALPRRMASTRSNLKTPSISPTALSVQPPKCSWVPQTNKV